MRCPRCRREIPEPAPSFCTGCGAPLKLGDEPLPPPLDAAVPIDRRAERGAKDETFAGFTPAGIVAAAAATAAPEGGDAGPAAGLAALGRPGWDLGAPVPRPERNRAIVPPAIRPPPEAPRAGAPAPASTAPAPAPASTREIHLRRPEPWRRAAADAIDVLPFVAGGIALARWLVRAASVGLPAPATGLDGFLDLVARERVIVLSVTATVALALAVYATLAHALGGATLGKLLLRLRVVGPDGARPSLARSAVRSALIGLSAALLGLGLLLALFTRSGRALHDLLARTWVVDAP